MPRMELSASNGGDGDGGRGWRLRGSAAARCGGGVVCGQRRTQIIELRGTEARVGRLLSQVFPLVKEAIHAAHEPAACGMPTPA